MANNVMPIGLRVCYFMVATRTKCSSLRLSKSRMTISMMFAQHPHTVMTMNGNIQWEDPTQEEKMCIRKIEKNDLRTLNRKIVLVFGLKIQL